MEYIPDQTGRTGFTGQSAGRAAGCVAGPVFFSVLLKNA